MKRQIHAGILQAILLAGAIVAPASCFQINAGLGLGSDPDDDEKKDCPVGFAFYAACVNQHGNNASSQCGGPYFTAAALCGGRGGGGGGY